MTTFYALPNAGPFWHWPTLIHFVLVALAGGASLLTALSALRANPHPQTRRLVALPGPLDSGDESVAGRAVRRPKRSNSGCRLGDDGLSPRVRQTRIRNPG